MVSTLTATPDPTFMVRPSPPSRHQAQSHRLRDVGHMHKIPALLAILEQNDFFTLPDPIGKDRQDAGVWVVERLAFSIDVLQAENQERNAQGVRGDAHQVFLGQLGGGVDGGGAGPGGLGSGNRIDRAAAQQGKAVPTDSTARLVRAAHRRDRQGRSGHNDRRPPRKPNGKRPAPIL